MPGGRDREQRAPRTAIDGRSDELDSRTDQHPKGAVSFIGGIVDALLGAATALPRAKNFREDAGLPMTPFFHSRPLACAVSCCALAILASCTTTPLGRTVRTRLPLEARLAERIDVPSVQAATVAEPTRDGELWMHHGTLRIDGDELSYRYYAPALDAEPAPFLLVLPILAGGESITDRVCRSLARRGIAAGTIERRWRLFRDHETIEQLEEKLIRVVRQQRAFLGWIAARPDIDGQHLGCFGLSIGGMLATVLTAVEPRIDCAVICLAGGDFGRLALEADEIKLERWVRQRCEEDSISAQELQQQIRARFGFDPVRFAPSIDASRVLFVSARFDGVVPGPSREALWRALGRPERVDVPLGHYTSILALEWIVSRAARFASDRLERSVQSPVSVALGR